MGFRDESKFALYRGVDSTPSDIGLLSLDLKPRECCFLGLLSLDFDLQTKSLMKTQIRNTLSLILALAVILTPIIYAQTATGRFVGVVKDSSGAVIPNAAVSVFDEKTGQERKITADNTG